VSTLPLESWEPSLYPDGEFGKFGNTYRSILSLTVGDSLDLAKIVEGAPNLKSAYVWRTKDGWEFRVASYSGTYGFSVEPEEIKENNGLFDVILKSADIDPPYPDEDKCACGCGAPSKSEFLPDHDKRFEEEFELDDSEDVDDDTILEPKVAPTLTNDVPDEDEGEIAPDVEPEVETPDAAQSPELPTTKPRRTEPDAYSKYLAKAMLNPKKVAQEASESQDDEFVEQEDLNAYLDDLINPLSYVPSEDEYTLAIELAGIRDQFVSVNPFPDSSKCACGCGGAAPRFGSYLVGHDLRHRSWLMKQINQGDAHAFEVFKNLGWLRYLYPDFRLPGDFGPEDPTLNRVKKDLKEDIKPSYNRKNLFMLAYKLALADVGYYSERVNLADLTPSQSDRLHSLWRDKADYLRRAESMLNSIDVAGSLVDIAGHVYIEVMSDAIKSGFKDIEYEAKVRFPQGSRNFSPSKVRKGEDVESLSLVQEPAYTAYRDAMEFAGVEFDPKAKFFNYLAMEIAKGKRPKWADSHENAWMAAANTIGNLPVEAKSFMADWWLEHGYKAAAESPPREFILIAKGVADYTATHQQDIVKNASVKYGSGDHVIVSVDNPKKQVLWYNDFLMEVTRTIEGQVYGRLKVDDSKSANTRWRDSASQAGLMNDSGPKEVKIDTDQILWLSPK
jgi:hypothetical protein